MKNEESVEVVRSVISAEYLARLVEEDYELGGAVQCQLRSVGDNDTYVVRAGKGRYVLRVYYPRYWIEDASHYHFEVDWLAFLRGRGLPVSYPLRRRDGELLGAVAAPEGTRYWTLMSWAEGVMVYPPDPGRIADFGRGIAEIQQASDEFESDHARFSYDLDFLFVDPIEKIAGLLGREHGEAVEYVAAVGRRAKEKIAALDLPAVSRGIVGGDYHGGNNHYDGDTLTFFDFDVCGYGWKVYDLAVFFHNHTLGGTIDGLWEPLLAGYESVRPLSAAEKAAVVPFAVGRRIWRVGVVAYEARFSGDQAFAQGDYWNTTIDAMRRWDEEMAR